MGKNASGTQPQDCVAEPCAACYRRTEPSGLGPKSKVCLHGYALEEEEEVGGGWGTCTKGSFPPLPPPPSILLPPSVFWFNGSLSPDSS